MKHCLIYAMLLLSGLSVAFTAKAQETVLRPVTSVYTLEAGSSHLADTYLTPLKYSGWQMALSYERWQAMKFSPQDWVMNLSGRLSFDRDLNPGKNATMWGAELQLQWAMMRRWPSGNVNGVSLSAGGFTDLHGGLLYLARNSNNPVSAKAAWNVGVSGMATWRLQVGRLPVVLAYRVSLPLVGVCFSPQYDELYYEIYLGNHKGLAHFAWPGDYFRIDQLLSADLRLGATALRVGYRCNIFTSSLSGLECRDISHCFTFGISGEWLSLGRDNHLDSDAKIISAFY